MRFQCPFLATYTAHLDAGPIYKNRNFPKIKVSHGAGGAFPKLRE